MESQPEDHRTSTTEDLLHEALLNPPQPPSKIPTPSRRDNATACTTGSRHHAGASTPEPNVHLVDELTCTALVAHVYDAATERYVAPVLHVGKLTSVGLYKALKKSADS